MPKKEEEGNLHWVKSLAGRCSGDSTLAKQGQLGRLPIYLRAQKKWFTDLSKNME
jgi:hypothetical protein